MQQFKRGVEIAKGTNGFQALNLQDVQAAASFTKLQYHHFMLNQVRGSYKEHRQIVPSTSPSNYSFHTNPRVQRSTHNAPCHLKGHATHLELTNPTTLKFDYCQHSFKHDNNPQPASPPSPRGGRQDCRIDPQTAAAPDGAAAAVAAAVAAAELQHTRIQA